MAPILALVAVGTLAGTLTGGVLADRVDRVVLCAGTSAAATVCAVALFFLAPGVWLSAALATVQMFVRSIYTPAYSVMVMGAAREARGTMLGLNAMTNNVGAALSTSSGGLALALGGYGMIGLFVVGYGAVSSGLFWLGRGWLRGVRG